jgi:PKD repeat protein
VGATIKFRFLFTHDGCNGNLGWFIDQVDAYHCVVNNPPVAAFKAVTPASGTSPLTVNFDASTSADADAGDSVVAFVVDFGDGSPVETFSVPLFTHTYTGAGDYTPKMTVRDSYELASSQITSPVTIKVTVPTPTNVAPTAAFKTITPTSGNSPLNVSFDVSTSSDPDAGDSIVEYVVDFGDGTMQSFTTATFSHTLHLLDRHQLHAEADRERQQGCDQCAGHRQRDQHHRADRRQPCADGSVHQHHAQQWHRAVERDV